MTTLVIHPGSPKTATSTLQHILRAHRAALVQQNIGLILPEDIRGKGYLGRYLAVYRGRPVLDIREATEAFFAPYLRFDTVVCSEETFCHDFMPSRKFATGGIDRAEIAAELLAMTGFDRVEVVLTIRPQVGLLASTYSHFVHRQREARSFEEWLNAEVDLERLLWRPVIAAFRNQFGTDAVRVLSLEMARLGGMDAFLLAVLGAMRIGHLGLSVSSDTVHNPSPSARAVELCCVMNSHIANVERSEKVNTVIVEQFPVEEFGRFKPDWSPPAKLAERYAADHEAALRGN